MEGALYLLVKQGILHRFGNEGVDADGKLADIARAFVRIEDLVELLGKAAGGFHDFALFKYQAHVFMRQSLVERGGIVLQHTLYAVADGRGVDLTVGYVEETVAFDGRLPFDGKAQVGPSGGQAHLIGALHQLDQRIHRPAHGAVIQRADFEEEVLKGLCAHAGLLGHGGAGVAQHHPPRLGHADLHVNGLGIVDAVQALLFLGHIG